MFWLSYYRPIILFLILLFVYIRQFLSSLFCVSHFIFHLFLKSMYSGIWWGAQSRCYKFTSALFQKIVLKWCFSTLKYPSFLVLLCWKIFFAVPCYYLSSNENLDLLTSYLLRSRECITSQPLFYLPGEKPFSRPHAGGQMDALCTRSNQMRNGEKESNPWEVHAMVSKHMLRGVATAIPSFLLPCSPHCLPCMAVQASFLVLPPGQGK